MTSIFDAYHQCWTQFGLAKALYSDGEGAFNNDTARAVFKAKGIELRTRARGRHATRIEASVAYYAIYIMSWKLNSKSWTNVLCSHDYCTTPYHEHPTEASDHFREQVIRRARTEAITQATAVAKANRVLRTKTTITGQH
eukprot:3119461-Pyramimonas_sp.AAC.1